MKQVSVTDAQQLAASGHLLVDVREQKEWDAGHAVGASHLPMSRITASDFTQGSAYLLICRSGARSGQVAMALEQAGFDATNVAGGTQAWQAQGLPMASENGQPPQVIAH